MGKRLVVIILTLAVVFQSYTVYADNVSDVLELYGEQDSVELEKEMEILNYMLIEYYEFSKEVANAEMGTIANSIYLSEYTNLIALQKAEISSLQKELDEVRGLIESNGNSSVDRLLELESIYLTRESLLNECITRLDNLINNPPKSSSVDLDSMKSNLQNIEKKVNSQESAVEVAASYPEVGDKLIKSYPLKSRSYITSDFGNRTDPISGAYIQHHNGLDLHAKTGSEVTAAYKGTVAKVGYDGALGYFVIINHGKGLRTLYGHLESYSVKEGQGVEQYGTIAKSGNSGSRSTGPHLHFGVYINGRPVDPKVIIEEVSN